MTPVRGTRVRPTGRGITVAVLAVLLLVASSRGGLAPARDLAAALLGALVVSTVCLGLALRGLGLRRGVREEAVTAPGTARVDLTLAPGSLLHRWPVATGAVRCAMPPSLGGDGEIALRPGMSHLLPVLRRGVHDLGPCRVRVRDVLGMLQAERVQQLPAAVVGLPRVETVDASVARRAGMGAAAGPRGGGEPGAFPRRYASGDDRRRIHWRASARTGALMTREDEPQDPRTAVVVLDDRRRSDAGPMLEERAISVAASLRSLLATQGWEVRLLDARGADLLRSGAAGTAGEREALVALARLDFRADTGDEPAAAPVVLPDAAGAALAVVVTAAADAGRAVERLDALTGVAGRVARRDALLILPGGPVRAVPATGWGAVTLPVDAPLADSLGVLAEAVR